MLITLMRALPVKLRVEICRNFREKNGRQKEMVKTLDIHHSFQKILNREESKHG